MSENDTHLGVIKHISHDHIRCAIHLAKLAHQTEVDFKSQNKEEIPFYTHKSYVTGSILLCVAFIEARINELIVGVTINVNPWNEGAIDKKLYKSLQEVGRLEGIKHLRTLDKYQLLLSIFSKHPFDPGAMPYQDVDLLIALRNKLMHFEPEVQWLDNEHYFLRKFRSKKLGPNPIAQHFRSAEFPDILLGYGSAKWAIKSSIKLVSEFDSRLNLKSNYADLETMLP